MSMQWVGLAIAGALGTLVRYFLTTAFNPNYQIGPFNGTWMVNILGSFLFGLIWILAEHYHFASYHLRFYFLIGFMGAFTTFSTFSFDTSSLIQNGQWVMAGSNLVLQPLCGLLFLYLGFQIGNLF